MTGPGTLYVGGWSFSSAHFNVKLGLRVTIAGLPVDNYFFYSGNVVRSDVVATYGPVAGNSGFQKTVAVKPIGTVQVCVSANDNGNWTTIGCQTVNTGSGSPDQTFYGWQFERASNSLPIRYLFLNNAPGTLGADTNTALAKWSGVSGGRLSFSYDFVSPNLNFYFDPSNNANDPNTIGQLRRVYYSDCPGATVVDLPSSEPMVSDRWMCTATSTEISIYVPKITAYYVNFPAGRASDISHEIGHAFGLAHHNAQASIMNSPFNPSSVTGPQPFDSSNMFFALYYTR